jgi:Tol biopolymer transport system component/predicted Ser/Thr protein kinase
MNRDRWRDVSRIYGAVLAKAPDVREVFLRDACGEDQELRREVESLLKETESLVIDGSASQLARALKVPALTAGAQLGPHRIESVIGAGGMGQVYRATDTRLNRRVAIKVLPSELADDPQFRARFEREAKAIASLNHPHICTLYDVGRDQGIEYLVMEYLEGESLASRLERGALPFNQALSHAIEIADALAIAHQQGIVHRDLKPGNIFLVRSGGPSGPPSAKLLDFGLAKTATSLGPAGRLSILPTTPPLNANAGPLTAQGTILGTFQYMAPEQLEGGEADARTDIFAFGAIVYEMLTGRKAFDGKSQASLIASIMHAEPPAILPAQPLTPPVLERAIRTCLAKAPEDRWQSTKDLLRELKWIATQKETESGATAGTAPANKRARIAWAVAGLLALGLAAVSLVAIRGTGSVGQSEAAPVQFNIPPPENAQLGGPVGGGSGNAPQLAISPDGSMVAFVAVRDNVFSLWVRPFNALVPRLIPGTEDASFPFWSTDSRFIGFFSGGKLKRVPVGGGPPISLCDAGEGRGGSWNSDNVIIFSALTRGGLQRVSASGGISVAATELDQEYGETNHRFPFFLPDGHHFLYTAVTGPFGAAPRISRIKVGALDARDTTTLVETESSALYSKGHLLFLRDGALLAQAFDLPSFKLQRDPFPLFEQISTEGSRYGSFSASTNGTLVFASGPPAGAQLRWFDRSGKTLGVVGETSTLGGVSLSPDEHHAVVTTSNNTNTRDIYSIDVDTGIRQRLTFGPPDSYGAVWSPDGKRIAYHTDTPPKRGIWLMSPSGSPREPLLELSGRAGLGFPSDWSPDGKYIALVGPSPDDQSMPLSRQDIWVVPTSGDQKPVQITNTPFLEDAATFSPDGRWIAYSSSEAGAGLVQVYVDPFPPNGDHSQVSRQGGGQPVWSRSSHEIFFVSPDSTIMSASYTTTPRFQADAPQPLFSSRTSTGVTGRSGYAVTRDGKRFLVVARPLQSTTTPFTVVTNWLAAVQK